MAGAVRTLRLESFILSKTTGKEESLYGATIYSYDREGYKTPIDQLLTDGSLSRQVLLTYDERKRLTEEAVYLGNGFFHEKTIYRYDNDNKTAVVAVYERNGSLASKIVFSFDPEYDLDELTGLQETNGLYRERAWVEAAQYDSSGLLLQKHTAVNSDDRREITLAMHSSEGLRTSEVKTVYIYDAAGQIADHYYVANGLILDKNLNDENVEQKRTHECEFDSTGNWTRKVFSWVGETRVEYRTITYY